MNRRWLLSRLAAFGPAVIATPALIEAMMPRGTIFLPPRQGITDLTEASLLEMLEHVVSESYPRGALLTINPTKIWFDGDKFQSRAMMHAEFYVGSTGQ